MTVDIVCAGPVFLDITFEGLEALPKPGEERFARDLHTTPGGAAITAIGLVRLGLSAAIAAPLGRDFAGTILRDQLEAAGVVCAGGRSARTPVAAVLPVGDERSFATFEPPGRVDPGTIERLRPRAVVVPLDGLPLAPDNTSVYATVGQRTVDRFQGRFRSGVTRARAVLANRGEALRLTGETEDAAAALGCRRGLRRRGPAIRGAGHDRGRRSLRRGICVGRSRRIAAPGAAPAGGGLRRSLCADGDRGPKRSHPRRART